MLEFPHIKRHYWGHLRMLDTQEMKYVIDEMSGTGSRKPRFRSRNETRRELTPAI